MKSSFPVLASGLLLLAGCAEQREATVGTPADPASVSEAVAKSDAPAEVAAEVEKSEASVEPDVLESPEEQLAVITAEFDKKYAEFRTAYSKAETPEEKSELIDSMPKASDYAERMLALADANPDSAAAVDALVWVSERDRGDLAAKAKRTLISKHSSDARVLPIVFMMSYGEGAGEEAELRGLLDHSDPNVRGTATYALGASLMKKDEESAEAQALLQTVVDDYANVSFDMRGRDFKIGPKAEASLFAINNLQIGMVAPEIEGTDLDGIEFKLSDYRGKVILLDFWGNW